MRTLSAIALLSINYLAVYFGLLIYNWHRQSNIYHAESVGNLILKITIDEIQRHALKYLTPEPVFTALVEGGLEFRGELIRLVRTLRGGVDAKRLVVRHRPKNAEVEFPNVSSMPRGCYEPWGIFRHPIPSGMKVSDCLRKFKTGVSTIILVRT